MPKPVQQSLNGASVRRLSVSLQHHWSTGWNGALDVMLEGDCHMSRLITMKELDTPGAILALGTCFEMIGALLGDYDPS